MLLVHDVVESFDGRNYEASHEKSNDYIDEIL